LEFFIQLLVAGLVVGSVYAMIALGFVLIYKSSGVINFAQGELLLFGAYLCLWLTVDVEMPFLMSFLVTLGFAVLLGFAIERVCLRPMIGEPVLSVIMLTIGLSAILRGLIVILWGPDTRVFPEIFPTAPLAIGFVQVSQVYVWSLTKKSIGLDHQHKYQKHKRRNISHSAAH